MAPLLRGQSGYSAELDRDSDGVACEQDASASGPVGGGTGGQASETTSSSTTTVTTTTLEARVTLEVTCEGPCTLADLSAPQLTGADGPISPDVLRALGQELGQQGTVQQLTTDDLADQLTKDNWELADTYVQDGGETLVFSSART